MPKAVPGQDLFVILDVPGIMLLKFGKTVTPKTEGVEYIRIVILCPIPVDVITGLVPAP